jgi:hypothetical protein
MSEKIHQYLEAVSFHAMYRLNFTASFFLCKVLGFLGPVETPKTSYLHLHNDRAPVSAEAGLVVLFLKLSTLCILAVNFVFLL